MEDNNNLSDLEIRFKGERSEWTAKIQRMSSNLKNISSLAETQVDLYSERQIGIEYLHELISTYSRLNKISKEKKAEYLKKLLNNNDYNIRLKNQENEILFEGSVAAIQHRLDILKTHMDFMKETVKTIDAIIYGVKYRLELEEFRRVGK